MKLPRIDELALSGKKVLLRADIDVGEILDEGDDTKLLTNEKTIKFLLEKNAKIIAVGHRGRPEGKIDKNLSLAPVAERLGKLLNLNTIFIEDINIDIIEEKVKRCDPGQIIFLENLRFNPKESFDPAQDAGAEEFAKKLAALGEIYVNEAFSSSAKKHASITGMPKFLPHAAGFHFIEEVENLSRVLENPKRPVIVIISGAKEDKLEFVEDFKKFADKILIAGLLPEYLQSTSYQLPATKIVVAKLNPDKEDITIHSIEAFEVEISKAKTIVLAGPPGKYEDVGHMQGTERVFRAVADSSAFKVAGGGDTEQAIEKLGLRDKFDWVSVGGGASLEFLAKGTLPGIEALISN